MEKSSSAPVPTLSAHRDKSGKSSDKHATSLSDQAMTGRSVFLGMALTMSWQLAVVVLVPILAGVKLDSVLGTGDKYTFAGLGLAVVASIIVMWHTMQVANRLPVPKLTAEQKRAIKKSYEEEDKDQ